MRLLDGKKAAADIKAEIRKEVSEIIDAGERAPHIAAILVGTDAASEIYVRNKEKDAKEVGFTASVYKYNADISEKELLNVLDFLNKDEELDGYIVQLPLPAHIDENKIIAAINPDKDIDGFHPVNIGRMMLGQECFLSATPLGIIELLKRNKIETEGRHCVVIGRSNIVGTPISLLMSRKSNPGNSTVTICHSKSKNIKEISLSADILIVAIGQCEFIKGDMIKEGAVVIDVGQHRIETDKGYILKGDVDYGEAVKKASFITPVPGGVGPMTRAALLINCLKAYKANRK